MLVGTPQVMCTGKPEPRAWEYNGRSGISYKITISDGTTNLELPVSDADVWNRFVPFGMHVCTIEISQVANDNRISTRCRIVDVQVVKNEGGKK